MSVEFTKVQWGELGQAIKSAGYTPDSFVRSFHDAKDGAGRDSITLTERESAAKFTVMPIGSQFRVESDVPGTTRTNSGSVLNWGEVVSILANWARELKQENEASDPWAAEAEDIANDDSYFTLTELPIVDEALTASLDKLKEKAIEHGVGQARVESELNEIKHILQKSARTSTKKEWITLFKGIIIEKLVDWGIKTAVFQGILHILIQSAQEITQLAQHAAHHLLQ